MVNGWRNQVVKVNGISTHLPAGVPNYVTQAGMDELLAEQQALMNEKENLDISGGKISFLSPLARVLTNKKAGDRVVLKRPKGEHVFEIINISYS
jgi:hypothetical protein